ncbi:hypothetical protein I0Q12_15245 [Rhodococcus sp. CX]|nr:hypothetical protein [Rhodococcus sp. CX]
MLPRTLTAVVTDPASQSGLTMDRRVVTETVRGRLVAYHDAEEDHDYVALMVGDVEGGEDVPVRAVGEERLLLEGGRSGLPAEILVGTGDLDEAAEQRELDRQLCCDGPLRCLLCFSGARSVTVDWCSVAAA